MVQKSIDEIARSTGLYCPAAYRFVYEGLGYTIRNITKEKGHISGQALCEGLRRLALDKYGRLAGLVLKSWGLRTTRDFGAIVYILVDNEWMTAQPTDSIDDFDDVYDFQTAFQGQPMF